MGKFKAGDRFEIEIIEHDEFPGMFKIKGINKSVSEYQLEKLRKIEDGTPLEYKDHIMKRFIEVN